MAEVGEGTRFCTQFEVKVIDFAAVLGLGDGREREKDCPCAELSLLGNTSNGKTAASLRSPLQAP